MKPSGCAMNIELCRRKNNMNTSSMDLSLRLFRRHRCGIVLVASTAVLLVILLLPLVEMVGRPLFGQGISGSINYVRHATLWFGCLGAVLAAKKSRHISLGVSSFLEGRVKIGADVLAHTLALVTCLVLARAALDMSIAESSSEVRLGGIIPLWLAQSVMPVSFVLLAARYSRQLMPLVSTWQLAVLSGTLIGIYHFVDLSGPAVLPVGLLIILAATLAGTPIYIVLGSLAALLFAVDGVPLASISVEAYRIASNPILPTIPLFTLAGTILAAGNASSRLVRLFEAWFGWLPGGSAIAAICVCAFFTTFTGGSGVTILALGGLMLPILIKQKYREGFSLGVLTSSGSLGILLPPSLLVILYGVASHTPINKLFVAGIVPGLLLISLTCGYAVYNSRSHKSARPKFDPGTALQTLWESKWEVLLPIGVLGGIFSGIATLVEVAAAAAAYTLFIECVVHREIRSLSRLGEITKECAILVGGIKIILASAMGLTSYLIYSDVPTLAVDLVQSVTDSPWVFLLALNAVLLLAGCLLDIVSAIVVVVPLMLPVAAAFGIDPLHLGIIFLANMELGYLTPPVGMNLYLSSFRFEKPLMTVFRAAFPFFVINLLAVLVITFVPAISVGVVQIFMP
jgi:C4-dicarboxylate transporter DctM subunit